MSRTAPAYPFSDVQTTQLEPEYRRLLEEQRLTRVTMPVGGQAWLATAYAHVKQVLADPRFSRRAANQPGVPRLSPEMLPESAILAQDPPEHTRLRRLIAKAFTARRVENLRPRTQTIVDQLLDAMVEAGSPADVVTHLASPLPTIVVCELLGVPVEGREHFNRFGEMLTSRELSGDEIGRQRGRFEEYLLDLIADRRRGEGDDLLSALLEAHEADDRLSHEELMNLVVALLVGGRGSPTVFLSSAIHLLLRSPEHWHQLVAAPEHVPAAVEELLRFIPIGAAGGFVRVATEDVVLGDVTVRAGEAVVPAMIAANHDDTVFTRPEQLDFHRTPNPHVGMGHGAHHCIGAPLARMQAQVALATLLRRFPGLTLTDEEAPWAQGRVVRSLSHLMVMW
jgi:nocardicin N-oxygenase